MLSTQIGRLHMGAGPLGSPALYDLPTVTVDTYGTITSGVSLLIGWTYGQAQSQPQATYRVVWTRDSDQLVYYDSGVVASVLDEITLNFDTVDVPSFGENAGTITVTVTMNAQYGQNPGGSSDPETITMQVGFPHMTITAPTEGGTVTTPQVTAAWTFTDDRAGKTQSAFRIKLLRTGDMLQLYDSDWISSAQTSLLIPPNLNHGTNYTIQGQLKNDNDILSD